MSSVLGVTASCRRTGGGGDPGPGGSSVLPVKVAGAYWPQWETLYPDQIHENINTLFLAFAINNGDTGAVYWDGVYNLSQANFQERLQTARDDGRCCILSVGGEHITLKIDNAGEVPNFVNSVKALYTEWDGFDGLDWDIEGGWITEANRQYHEQASRELKDFYGGDFAISMSYQGPDTVYKTMAQNLETTGDLDWASIQYYDYGPPLNPSPDTPQVVSRLAEMVNTYGIDPSHLGVGVKIVPGSGSAWQSGEHVRTMWNTVEATYPTLRGVVLWDSITDRTNGDTFATVTAPAITS